MPLMIKRENGEEMVANCDLALTADKTQVVEDGTPEARYVLAGKGGPIPPEYRNLPGLEKYLTAPQAQEADPRDARIAELEKKVEELEKELGEAKKLNEEPNASDDPAAKALTSPPANKAIQPEADKGKAAGKTGSK